MKGEKFISVRNFRDFIPPSLTSKCLVKVAFLMEGCDTGQLIGSWQSVSRQHVELKHILQRHVPSDPLPSTKIFIVVVHSTLDNEVTL